MKIKRFVAADMRTAIRLVQEEQGPDAVILSNRRVGDRIEVVAATDYDESLVHQALREPEGPARPEAEASKARAEPAPGAGAPTLAPASDPGRIVWAQDPHLEKLERELGDLRHMLEGRLGQVEDLAWEARAPQRNQAIRELERIGVDVAVARAVVEKLPEGRLPAAPAEFALRMLVRRVALMDESELAAQQVVALVGPTGVGKTTTIAKLAARHAMRHGAQGLTLVSTDGFRIGAQEQLRTYGRLLGVPVVAAASAQELCAVVEERRGRGLVLIDTAGVGPRDAQLREQFDALQALPQVTTLLCVAAHGYCEDLLGVAARFAPASPAGCILTRLDETRRIGAALSLAVRQRLPLAYFTDGQNVPADLHPARRETLLDLATAQLAGPPPRRPAPEVARACA